LADIHSILDSFTKLDVLIIGDAMVDEYVWGAVERISPEAPVPVVHVCRREYRLGGAANVALNIQALGATPRVVSLFGNDAEGTRLAALMKQHGIPTEGLIISGTRPTTVKTRVIAGHQHVVRIDAESDAEPTSKEEQGLLAAVRKLLPSCQVVVFEDYDKGTLSGRVIAETISLARQHSIPTIVDPKKRNFLTYKGATLFKPNLKELREGLALDVEAGQKDRVSAAVKDLKKLLELRGVLLTLSGHGMFLNMDEVESWIPAHAREIADVSGAGDTVVAVAAVGLGAGLPPETLAALSNLAGGLVCQHAGVVPVDRAELIREAASLHL
jgi:rfaE bifunctional protein kinase chain/domain